MDHSVRTGHLKLNGPDESRAARRFQAPRKEIRRKCWNVTRVDKAKLRTGGYLHTQSSIKITIRGSGPPPNRVFDQLTIGLPVQNTAAKVSMRFRR
jgi:hypothetical protein